MSVKKEIGIRIFLDADYITDNSITSADAALIGIYSTSGNNEIRWSTSEIDFDVDVWKTWALLDNNDSIYDSVDIRRFGGINKRGGISIGIDNTKKISNLLNSYQVYLNGFNSEIIEFDIDDENSKIIYTGITNVSNYNETNFTINIDYPNDHRDSNIAKKIDKSAENKEYISEKIFAVLYGNVETARFSKISDVVKLIDTNDYFGGELSHRGTSFPVVWGRERQIEYDYYQDTNNQGRKFERNEFIIRLSDKMNPTIFTDAYFKEKLDLVGKYVFINEGTGKGQYRLITGVTVRPNKIGTEWDTPLSIPGEPVIPVVEHQMNDVPVISILIDKYFSGPLQVDWYANSSDDQTWVSFVDIDTSWKLDKNEISNFVDEDGNVVSHPDSIYAIVSKSDDDSQITNTFKKIPTYSLFVEDDGNTIRLKHEYIDKQTNSVKALTFFDPEEVLILSELTKFIKEGDEDIDIDLYAEDIIRDSWEENQQIVNRWHGKIDNEYPFYSLKKFLEEATLNVGGPYPIQFTAFNLTVSATPLNQYKSVVTDGNNNTGITVSASYNEAIPKSTLWDLNSKSNPSRKWCYGFGITLKMPDFTKYEYDDIYLSLSLSVQPLDVSPSLLGIYTGPLWLLIRTRKFYGGVKDVYSDFENKTVFRYDTFGLDGVVGQTGSDYSLNANVGLTGILNTFPLDYWTTPPEDSQYQPIKIGLYAEGITAGKEAYRDFFSLEPVYNFANGAGHMIDPSRNVNSLRRGYINLKLPKQDDYNKNDEIGIIVINHIKTHTPWYDEDGSNFNVYNNLEFKLREVQFMLEQSVKLESSIYTNVNGRVDANGDLINNPIDFMFDMCSRQNWSELNGTPPVSGWGSEILSAAKIKNDSEFGAYNFSALDYVRTLPLSHQVIDEEEAWTIKLKEKCCHQFWLTSYQDKNGYESIDYIIEPMSASSVRTITLSDIVGKIKPVSDNKESDIFCQPTVYYDKDYESGEYKKSISVSNVSDSTYSDSFVIGATEESMETIWNLCHGLYEKYRIINQAPVDMINLDMIKDQESAQHFLLGWLYWQNRKRISFNLPYEIASDWHISTRFGLKLPHQTNDSIYYCIVEKINKNVPIGLKTKNLVTIDAVFYSDDEFVLPVIETTETTILSAGFNGYPGSQTEVKYFDDIQLTVETSGNMVSIQVYENDLCIGKTITFPSTNSATIDLKVNFQEEVTSALGAQLRIKGEDGNWSQYFYTISAGSTDGYDYLSANNLYPYAELSAVDYSTGFSAVSNSYGASAIYVYSGADSASFISSQLSITDPTTLENVKEISYVSGGYNLIQNNLFAYFVKDSNNSTTTVNSLIKIANTSATIRVVANENLAMEIGEGCGNEYEVSIYSNQPLLIDTINLVPNGAGVNGYFGFLDWDNVNASDYPSVSGFPYVYMRPFYVNDDATPGTYQWASLYTENWGGIVTSAINTDDGFVDTYTISGSSIFEITFDAWPNRKAALPFNVADYTKLIVYNLSKGEDYQITFTSAVGNELDKYTLVDSNGDYDVSGGYIYNCDAYNAVSNTTGTLTFTVEETQ